MPVTSASRRTCWCRASALVPFTEEYARCSSCETLVLTRHGPAGQARVVDDDADFYGRGYWFSHQENDLGHPNLVARARQDLAERCVYWLRALLRYRLPPGRVLELGCAHGGFVWLLSAAGFDAAGLELSPWVVEFARRTFGVRVYLGPLEDQALEPASLDVIAAMDVIEHLADPADTIERCASLLVDDGVLLLQTPRYAEGATIAALRAANDPFLSMLRADQHIYLFSESSLRQLLRRAGLAHVALLPAIFGHYDMFVVASRRPLVTRPDAARDDALADTPAARLVQALLDKDDEVRHQRDEWQGRLDACEVDRAARLEIIETLSGDVERLSTYVAQLRRSLGGRILNRIGLLPGPPPQRRPGRRS